MPLCAVRPYHAEFGVILLPAVGCCIKFTAYPVAIFRVNHFQKHAQTTLQIIILRVTEQGRQLRIARELPCFEIPDPGAHGA